MAAADEEIKTLRSFLKEKSSLVLSLSRDIGMTLITVLCLFLRHIGILHKKVAATEHVLEDTQLELDDCCKKMLNIQVSIDAMKITRL